MRRWSIVRSVVNRLWPRGANGRAPVRRDSRRETEEWMLVVADGPAPLLEMYRDVLSKNGIPAMLRSEGAGRGALGGAPTLVRLLVPASCERSARELLELDGSDVDDRESDLLGERTQGGGER